MLPFAAAASLLAPVALAGHTAPASPPPLVNHGPGTTGGGSSTLAGETLRRGAWSVDLRLDWSEYEDVSTAEAEAIAAAVGEFDALDSSLVTSFSAAYGLTDDLELGAQIGWYTGDDFLDAEEDGLGGAESATAEPQGLTDLWLTAKYRVLRGTRGHLAVLGGVKLPVGEHDETLSNGEELEPSSQPGTGAFDGRVGLGYSRFLSASTTLDASAAYTLRGTDDGFQVGDRLDLGVAVAYRFGAPGPLARGWTIFGELTGVVLGKDEESGDANENSGGEILFLSPGARYRFESGAAISLAPAVPLAQDWNGEQIDTDYKVALTLSFGG